MSVTRLIRDQLATKEREGVRVEYLQAGSPMHKIALIAKLHEEVCEVEKAGTDVYEYGDVLQVLIDHAALHGISFADIKAAQEQKLRCFGGFSSGAIMVRE